jgi:hypothetical protein
MCVGNIYQWRIEVHVFLLVYVIVFGRGVNIFNFQILHLMKVVYFSQINQVHCRTLITALVGIKIKCYLIFTLARNNFISFLEIIAFQCLRMNTFTGKNIKKLHAQISLWRFKNTPSSCICAVYVTNIQFQVTKFLTIHIKVVSYEYLWRDFCRRMVKDFDFGLLLMNFNVTLR